MTVLKLLLVRHGQSVGNTEGRMEGTSSTGLTPLGEQQSLRLGQHLADIDWCPTHLYCSPLARATATLAWLISGFKEARPGDPESPARLPNLFSAGELARQVTLIPGQAISIDLRDDLKEYDSGIFTGLTWAEASQRHPDLCHQLETSLDWLPIPQAETLEAGQARAQRVVDRLIDPHRSGDRILVISHQWILQQIIARLLGCDRAWGLPMANTACFEFWIDRDRWHDTGPNRLNTELWRIKQFNATPHLQGQR
ncbi:MAG: histidine phosphatase family protein [Shackletoniella antarctica]|uniref:Histidine phosphatase family protein n=1 Tax=Shackletoniella antarctica TaxID=268115 RepID=A0A2W4W8T3_9CYAN|nr:MAG: histidine phosphatase family protein [Shackletoniella antarctica]